MINDTYILNDTETLANDSYVAEDTIHYLDVINELKTFCGTEPKLFDIYFSQYNAQIATDEPKLIEAQQDMLLFPSNDTSSVVFTYQIDQCDMIEQIFKLNDEEICIAKLPYTQNCQESSIQVNVLLDAFIHEQSDTTPAFFEILTSPMSISYDANSDLYIKDYNSDIIVKIDIVEQTTSDAMTEVENTSSEEASEYTEVIEEAESTYEEITEEVNTIYTDFTEEAEEAEEINEYTEITEYFEIEA